MTNETSLILIVVLPFLGSAAAATVILFVMILALTLLQFKLVGRKVEY